MGTEEVVYLPIKLAQALQDALFSHPGAGSVPVPASLLTLVMEELRKTPWSENERTLLANVIEHWEHVPNDIKSDPGMHNLNSAMRAADKALGGTTK